MESLFGSYVSYWALRGEHKQHPEKTVKIKLNESLLDLDSRTSLLVYIVTTSQHCACSCPERCGTTDPLSESLTKSQWLIDWYSEQLISPGFFFNH